MNLYLHINDLKRDNDIRFVDEIRFLYSKQNTVMDGEFTKILFSRENFTMNGLHMLFPIMLDPRCNKTEYINHIRSIHNNFQLNTKLLQDFCLLERNLLTQYKKYSRSDKQIDLCFYKQISSKQIRVYTESNHNVHNNVIIIKISGIWESRNQIGMTYKIVELCPM
jgi:hypothetical protein